LNVDGSRDKTDDCNNDDYNNNVEDWHNRWNM
jgi:hypothetical protein